MLELEGTGEGGCGWTSDSIKGTSATDQRGGYMYNQTRGVVYSGLQSVSGMVAGSASVRVRVGGGSLGLDVQQ